VLIEPGVVVTRRTPLAIPRWPTGLGPVRIVAISDLHTGAPHITVDKLRLVAARVNAAHPDLIVLLGDYVIHGVAGGHFVEPERTAAALRDLTAPLGVFARIPARVLLTLAGHAHGGQVNLPLLGRLIVPSRYGERFTIGHVREQGRDLFVTPGVGTSIVPVRFRVPPEISVLTVGR
jgi:predicted MPP superfamily phosphohydrolase